MTWTMADTDRFFMIVKEVQKFFALWRRQHGKVEKNEKTIMQRFRIEKYLQHNIRGFWSLDRLRSDEKSQRFPQAPGGSDAGLYCPWYSDATLRGSAADYCGASLIHAKATRKAQAGTNRQKIAAGTQLATPKFTGVCLNRALFVYLLLRFYAH